MRKLFVCLILLTAGCSSSIQVVTDVHMADDGSLKVKKCDLYSSWNPPPIGDSLELQNCKVESR